MLRAKFINAGVLDERVTIRAAGRVGGPASMATSRDGGRTWTSEDLSAVAAMVLDVKFVDERTGFLCAGSDAAVERSHSVRRPAPADWPSDRRVEIRLVD